MDMTTTISWSKLQKSLGLTSYTLTSTNTISVLIRDMMSSSEGFESSLVHRSLLNGVHLDILEKYGRVSLPRRISGTFQMKLSIYWINYSAMTIRSV